MAIFPLPGPGAVMTTSGLVVFDIIVLAISLITYNKGSIIRITRNQIKHVYFDSKLLQTFLKRICAFLSGILGDADTSYISPRSVKTSIRRSTSSS